MLGMQRQELITNYPGLQAAGMAVFSGLWNERRYWTHAGLIAGFRTELLWFPELDFGVFVAFAGGSDPFGSAGGSPRQAVDNLLTELLGPYRLAPAIEPEARTEVVAGHYWSELRSHTLPETVYHMGRMSTVTPAPDGAIVINGTRHIEIAPGLFQPDLQSTGRVRLVALDRQYLIQGANVFKRVDGWVNPALWQRLLVAFTIVLITSLIPLSLRRGVRRMACLVTFACGLAIACMLLRPLLMDDPWLIMDETFPGVEWRYQVGAVTGFALIPAGLFCATACVVDWRRGLLGQGGWLINLHVALVGVSALGMAAIFYALNLI
jgi:hypothetical protein